VAWTPAASMIAASAESLRRDVENALMLARRDGIDRQSHDAAVRLLADITTAERDLRAARDAALALAREARVPWSRLGNATDVPTSTLATRLRTWEARTGGDR
jgi:hypothetical protein